MFSDVSTFLHLKFNTDISVLSAKMIKKINCNNECNNIEPNEL